MDLCPSLSQKMHIFVWKESITPSCIQALLSLAIEHHYMKSGECSRTSSLCTYLQCIDKHCIHYLSHACTRVGDETMQFSHYHCTHIRAATHKPINDSTLPYIDNTVSTISFYSFSPNTDSRITARRFLNATMIDL